MMRNAFSIILTFIFLTGCTLAPKYKRPEAPVPSSWPSGPAYKERLPSVPTASELKWEEFFTDERLKKIIGMALNNNRDLRLAALNVERAQAFYGIQRAELFPALDVVGSGSKERVPADLSETRERMTRERYSVDLGILSWEIDFFGRIRSLTDRALEEYLATEEARRSAEISLLSAVANTYLALAADREILKLSQSTLKTQEAVYKLIKLRYEIGLASQLDLRRAQTQVDTARGDVARYTKLVAQGENALNLLVGSSVPNELSPRDLGGVSPPKEFSPGITSDVLLSRPDILAAEHQLKALHANIGAARAAFFPRISLTTTLGTASSELSGLFKSGSGAWSFVPQIIMPIFDTRTWLALKAVKVEREIAVAQYEKAIQTAFREVADALAQQGTIKDQITAQESLVQALQETYRLSYLRYTKGIDSYLSVLDAQRSLYAAEQGLIALRLAEITNQVTLYKVLGGGDRASRRS
jgi:multidrug efflux system outer membrane protein